MRIGITADNTMPLHVQSLVSFVDQRASNIKFAHFDARPRFKSSYIGENNDIAQFEADHIDHFGEFDMIFVATAIPYQNNFFFEGRGKLFIVSFADWHHLTSLPISNGIVFIICEIIVKYIMEIGTSHEENTGCVCDFLWDKRGIDVCMRAAFICDDCRKVSKKNKYIKSQELIDISQILNSLSEASRQGLDVLSIAQNTGSTNPKAEDSFDFDVFLCHNSKDKENVRDINNALKKFSIKTWFDEERLEPGDLWQAKLEKTITRIKSCMIIVGDSGFGPWQGAEQRAFIDEFLSRGCVVIPVIIGSAKNIPELPLFLRQFMWSDLRQNFDENLKRIAGVLQRPPI